MAQEFSSDSAGTEKMACGPDRWRGRLLRQITKVMFPRCFPGATVDPSGCTMSTGTSTGKYRCAQCERSENDCECEKYCCLCQTTLDDIRLCQDGLMYCEPCRKACDYKTSS